MPCGFSGRVFTSITLLHFALLIFVAVGKLGNREFIAQPSATLMVTTIPSTVATQEQTLRPSAQVPATKASVKPVSPPSLTTSAASPAVTEAQPSKESTVSQPVVAQTAARFDADYLQNPSPVYPPMSRRLGEEGKVILRVLVEPAGVPSTIEIKVSSGSVRLDQAALDAVRRWKFVPAKQGADAVTAWVLVPILFNLRG
jgi:periplasmic protein TonB